MTKDEEITMLKSALKGLLDVLGDGTSGDDCTEWCVACQIGRSSTEYYRLYWDAYRDFAGSPRPLDWPAFEALYPDPPIPHKSPCPLEVAREAIKERL